MFVSISCILYYLFLSLFPCFWIHFLFPTLSKERKRGRYLIHSPPLSSFPFQASNKWCWNDQSWQTTLTMLFLLLSSSPILLDTFSLSLSNVLPLLRHRNQNHYLKKMSVLSRLSVSLFLRITLFLSLCDWSTNVALFQWFLNYGASSKDKRKKLTVSFSFRFRIMYSLIVEYMNMYFRTLDLRPISTSLLLVILFSPYSATFSFSDSLSFLSFSFFLFLLKEKEKDSISQGWREYFLIIYEQIWSNNYAC